MGTRKLVLVDLDGPKHLQDYYDSLDSWAVDYCEDVLGEFPETHEDALDIIAGRAPPRPVPRVPGSDGWQAIGHRKAVSRWKDFERRLNANDEFYDRDIIIAEAALAAYRATGKPVPARLADFLEVPDGER